MGSVLGLLAVMGSVWGLFGCDGVGVGTVWLGWGECWDCLAEMGSVWGLFGCDGVGVGTVWL